MISQNCGEWGYLFATNVANEKILLDIAGLGDLESKSRKRDHIIPFMSKSPFSNKSCLILKR